MKKLNILILLTILWSTQINGQSEGDQRVIPDIPIQNVYNWLFLGDDLDHSKTIIEKYMDPLGKSIGTGLNAGWYNTGKPHRFPGFDITIGGHVISLPSESQIFNTTINFTNPNGTYSIEEHNTIANGWSTFYLPYAQGSIGLINKTELLFRYMPPITYSDITSNYWGIGVKHDFKQYVPIVGKLPFDLSFLAAYSNFKSNYNSYAYDEYERNLNFDIQAFNCNIILSKKIAFITAYAGAGYQHSTSSLVLDGYSLPSDDGFTYVQDPPLNLSLGGVNGFKTNIGARLKFLLFTIHADYTVAEYNIFTIGIGLNSDIGSRIIGGTIEKATKKDKKKKKEDEEN